MWLAASRAPASERQQPDHSLVSVGIVLRRRKKSSSTDTWAYWEEAAVSLKAASSLCHSPRDLCKQGAGLQWWHCLHCPIAGGRVPLRVLLVLPQPVLQETAELFLLLPWEHLPMSPLPSLSVVFGGCSSRSVLCCGAEG